VSTACATLGTVLGSMPAPETFFPEEGHMPKQPINLDALERVTGKAPPRYPPGDRRNLARVNWWNNAIRALGCLLHRGRVCTERTRSLKSPISNLKPGGQV